MRSSFYSGLRDSSLNALSQYIPFESANTASMPASARPLGVARSRAFTRRYEADLERRQFLLRVHQVHQGASPAVEPPDHDQINVPPLAAAISSSRF